MKRTFIILAFFVTHVIVYGQLGIGTSSPSGMLHIDPTTSDAIVIDPFGTNTGETGEIQFKELAANGSNHISFKAADDITASVVYTLPASDGSNGQAIVTDGSGNLSWGNAGSGWEELDNVSWTSGSNITTNVFATKKYLNIKGWYEVDNFSGAFVGLRVGNGTIDAGNNYSGRFSSNGNADIPTPSITSMYPLVGRGSENVAGMVVYFNIFCINDAGNEKLCISEVNMNEVGGAGNATLRVESIAKWVNTTNQINIIDINRMAGSGNFSGGEIVVLGRN